MTKGCHWAQWHPVITSYQRVHQQSAAWPVEHYDKIFSGGGGGDEVGVGCSLYINTMFYPICVTCLPILLHKPFSVLKN